jgi:hypothetical protein
MVRTAYVIAFVESCYIDGLSLQKNASIMFNYLDIYPDTAAVVFESAKISSIKLKLSSANELGGVLLGIKMNSNLSIHGPCIYVCSFQTELGLLETFGKRLGKLLDCDIGTKISLLGDIV